MKLLLIFCPLKNFVYTTFPSMVPEEAGTYPPLGLLSLATSVMQRGNHKVKVLDSIAEKYSHEDVENYIRKEKPDVVGITLITDYLRDGLLVAKAAKRVNPGIKVIAGGHHVSLYPAETIKQAEIDYAVLGDGDYVINEMLDRIQQGRPLDELEGVVTKANFNNGKLKPLIVEDLNKLPVIRRDIVDYRKYESVIAKKNPITTMMSSRGCPFRCPYCTGGGIKPRSISVERFMDEIESCVSLGIRDILIFDELFTLNRDRVVKVCDELIRRSIKIRWHVRARIDRADREILDKMKKAGCRMIQYGIETGSQRIQKILERDLKLEKIEEVVRMTRDAGILTYGNFMFNSPTETVDEMNQTIEFAIKLKLDYAVFGIVSVYPKTTFYMNLLKEGRLQEDFWKLYAESPFSYRVKSTLWPGEYDLPTLDNVVKKAYSKFYIRPKYLLQSLFRDNTLQQKYLQVISGVKLLFRTFKEKLGNKH